MYLKKKILELERTNHFLFCLQTPLLLFPSPSRTFLSHSEILLQVLLGIFQKLPFKYWSFLPVLEYPTPWLCIPVPGHVLGFPGVTCYSGLQKLPSDFLLILGYS